jgi:glycosyltransferase involved in cell wall biosynthesis
MNLTRLFHKTVAIKHHTSTMDTHLHIQRLAQERQRLKISVVTETYPPDINGVAMTLARIVNGLVSNGHDILLIRPKHFKHDAPSDREGFQEKLVHGLPIPFYKQLRMGLPSKKELLRLWTFNRPDMVHIATEGPLGWSALQAARKLRLPVSTDFRTNFHAYSNHYKIGWLSSAILSYLKKFHNAANVTMVPTSQLESELHSVGFENLHIVPRGIDTRLFHPRKRSLSLRQRWGVDEQTTVMLYVGRLAAEKNLPLVIQSHEMAKKISPLTKLVLVGDGPLMAELRHKYPDIIFSGFKTGEELAMHYASADMFVFASQTETFGNVTLEAMASGLAVVAFNHAAASELILSGQNGMLAAQNTDIHFEMAVQAMLNNPFLMNELKINAVETARNFSWESIVERTESVFLDVISNHRSPVHVGLKSPLSLVSSNTYADPTQI